MCVPNSYADLPRNPFRCIRAAPGHAPPRTRTPARRPRTHSQTANITLNHYTYDRGPWAEVHINKSIDTSRKASDSNNSEIWGDVSGCAVKSEKVIFSMPRKRGKSSVERKSDCEDDDFFFDDSQSGSGRSSHEPQHRNAANARERARMRVLSKAFCRLKTTLPWVPADTKLSKLDTLRLAASYIAHLRALLHDEPRSAKQMFPHPLNLAWPFAFQHGGTLNSSVSPRWSANSSTSDLSTQDCRNDSRMARDNPNSEPYIQEYSEHELYEKRCCVSGNMVQNATPSCPTVQYSNYAYKETYYEMRNSFNSESVMN